MHAHAHLRSRAHKNVKYMHPTICMYSLAHTLSFMATCGRTRTNTHVYATRTYTHTRTHAHTHTHTHTHIHTYTLTHIHTYTHTHIHTYVHAHSHAQAHAHTNMNTSMCGLRFPAHMIVCRHKRTNTHICSNTRTRALHYRPVILHRIASHTCIASRPRISAVTLALVRVIVEIGTNAIVLTGITEAPVI